MTKEQQAELIRAYLRERYAGDHPFTVQIRDFLEEICIRHLELDLGDADMAFKLTSGDDARYCQQLSEILLANEITSVGRNLTPSHEGPDFLIEHEGRKVWVEVICPTPTGIPEQWFRPQGEAFHVPHEAILLRWTAAIKEKAEKLLGNAITNTQGYLDKGVVSDEDVYVIAVNATMLRGNRMASIFGISQFPYAVEAAFSVGPFAITLNQHNLEMAGSGYVHRPTIRKPNGADVPAYTFLDPKFQRISAIWACDIDESWVIGNMKPLAVIYNPQAIHPLPVGVLPSYDDYIAIAEGPEAYTLDRVPGQLQPTPAKPPPRNR